ncbi:MAG: hypothetical protein C0410_15755, partial [Anaerolinea sp.]|nr:hypothetical protein [Anaerolinea sp.]
MRSQITFAIFLTLLFLAGCKKDETPTGGGGGGLTATPSSMSVQAGQQATARISGGTRPYSIQTQPNTSIATATMSGDTLKVTGVAAGSASVLVRDSSGANTVSVSITVTSGGLDLTGTWIGAFTTSIITTPTQITLLLSQSGSNVTGTYSSQAGGVGTVSGTLSGSTLTFTLHQTTTNCSGTFSGTGTVSGNTMTFTFSGNDCLGTHTNGQGTVTRSTLPLTANPSSITVQVGQNAQAQISGGTLPYEIQNPPNASIATASIGGTSTLIVNGTFAGSTSVTVRDNSSPVRTVTVPITVTTSTFDSVFVRIKLLHIPSTLTFNQSHVPTNYVEYWWGILFNTDGNASTGLQGYDIEIALAYAKQAGNP